MISEPPIHIASLADIQRALPHIDLVPCMERAFVAYSEGRAVVPPVTELLFDHPQGDVHIKCGYIRGERFYVVKIASGFYDNPKLGMPSSNGLMLLFEQQTGRPVAILLDEGHLTDRRTAAAGAVCAKYLAPKNVRAIGIIGAGIQARLQLAHLKHVIPCREAVVCARNKSKAEEFGLEMTTEGFHVRIAESPEDLARSCNLIITTTPSTQPLLTRSMIQPGTHITAVGSDTPEKQELDSGILADADLVVADSLAQCQTRGEIHHALKNGFITLDSAIELGFVIAGKAPGRANDGQMTVADLTGVAVQDMMIAQAVYACLTSTRDLT